MVSRKTYFGIGLPKDPTDPPTTLDSADQSSPTVVDDDKVAESLKQLRSWYQSDGPEDDTKRVVVQPAPAASSMDPQPRPTAVGHATGDTPMHTQRPVAPDPMRATMFGHDIHRFDLDLPQSGSEPPIVLPDPQPGFAGAAPSFADHPTTRRQESRARAPEPAPAPAPADRAAPEALRLAEYLRNQAAQRQPQATWVSNLDDTDVRAKASDPMAARVVFGIGVAALALAIVVWILSQNNAGSGLAPAPAAPAAIGIDRPAPIQPAPPSRSAEGSAREVGPERSSTDLDLGSRTATVARRPAVLPQADVLPKKPARPPAAAKPRVQERSEDDSASVPPDSRPPEEAPVGGPGSTVGKAAAGSGDTELAPPPPPPPEPARPAKSRETKAARTKTGISGDSDATLPPSTTD